MNNLNDARELDDETRKFELMMQTDAVARARYLLGERRSTQSYSLREILQNLADAELKSQYVCGFVEIVKHDAAISSLEKHLIDNKYVLLGDDGKITLTQKGLARSRTLLPEQIEQYL